MKKTAVAFQLELEKSRVVELWVIFSSLGLPVCQDHETLWLSQDVPPFSAVVEEDVCFDIRSEWKKSK